MRILLISIMMIVSPLLMAKESDSSERELVEAGKKIFMTTCFACHGPDGKGLVPGTPDMTTAESRLKQEDSVLKKHIWEGYQSKGSPLAMPEKGANPNLKESDLDALVAFMKKTFMPKN